MAETFRANELTSLSIAATLKDKAGNPVPGSALDVLMITIHHTFDRTLRLRSSDDALADTNITVDESGVLTWNVRPYETEILQPDLVPMGRTERHRVVFEYAWESPRTGSLSNPFATTADSKTVTVTHPAHGLLVRDNVYFVDTVNVGGLDIGGHYVVRSVVDSDSYTIEHFDAASSTESGGGSPVWYANGKAGSEELFMLIKRFDAV